LGARFYKSPHIIKPAMTYPPIKQSPPKAFHIFCSSVRDSKLLDQDAIAAGILKTIARNPPIIRNAGIEAHNGKVITSEVSTASFPPQIAIHIFYRRPFVRNLSLLTLPPGGNRSGILILRWVLALTPLPRNSHMKRLSHPLPY